MTHLHRLIALAAAAAIPALAAPETYKVDPDHTYPHFTYSHLGFSSQQGRFDRTTGTLTLDVEAKTGSVEVTISMDAVSTGSDLDKHLRGPDFFDVARYPTATYKSTKVVFEGDRPVAVEGELTMKGVTLPVALRVTSFKTGLHPMQKKRAIGASATATVSRTAFGAGKYVPLVSDEVRLDITIEAVRQ